MTEILRSDKPGWVPTVAQLKTVTLGIGWNRRDGLLYGLKKHEDGTWEVVLIGGGGGGTKVLNGQMPTGWINNQQISVGASSGVGARVSLSGMGERLYYMWRGTVKSVVNGWTSEALNFSAGQIVWLYSHDGKSFHWSTTPPAFDDLWVAAMMPGLNFAIKLIYGVTDGRLRELLLKSIHSVLVRGGGLVPDTFALETDLDSANTPAFNLSVMRDVDIDTPINAWPDTSYTWLWFEGASNSVFDNNKPLPFKIAYGATYPVVNRWISEQEGYALDEAQTLKYLNYYVVLIPAAKDVTSQKYRLVILQPQRQHDTLMQAQMENPRSLIWGNIEELKDHFYIAEKLIYKTDAAYTTTGKVQLVDYTANLDSTEGWLYEAFDASGAPIVGRVVPPGYSLVQKAGDRIKFTGLPYNEGISIKADASVYSGATNPTAELGITGDHFLNFLAGTWLEKINADTWQLRFTFNAGSFYSGSGTLPDPADYKANDHYFKTDTGGLYKHFGGVWTLVYTVTAITLVDDILHFDANKYTPYAAKAGTDPGKAYFYLGNDNPTLAHRMNLDGELWASKHYARDVYGTQQRTAEVNPYAIALSDTDSGDTDQLLLSAVSAILSKIRSADDLMYSLSLGIDTVLRLSASKTSKSTSQTSFAPLTISAEKITLSEGTANKWLKLNANKEIEYEDEPAQSTLNPATTTFSGTTAAFTAGETFASGELGYLGSNGKIYKADADALGTALGICIATDAISADASGVFLLFGFKAGYTSLTVGGAVYASTTPGALTQTPVSGTDDVGFIAGVAVSATVIYFNPSLTTIERT